MNTYNANQFAKKVGKSVKTLQRWDREGVLVPRRSPKNRRIYDDEDLRTVLGLQNREVEENRKIVAYCRVSSQAQKSDLQNQRTNMELFTASLGYFEVEWVEEIGGGLNFKRPKFTKLMEQVQKGEISTLVVAHKDRLTRFGFDWFLHFCEFNSCELKVLNHQTLSPEREMVEDLMTIIHCFSSRLYGLRRYRKTQDLISSESNENTN